MKTFAEIGVAPDISATLAEHGIETPFPIQALAVPLALGGHDLIGQARTGTGKTLAFTIPLLHRVEARREDPRPQALVVVPTRELAAQVARDVDLAAGSRGVRVSLLYGGRAYEPQVEQLKRGVDIVVGTPGRLLDLAKQRHLDLSDVRALVLDEADEMLDLGFLPDVERIVSLLPQQRQTMLFSATMPSPVVTLARRYLSHPTHVRAESPDESATVPTTSQFVFRTHRLDKPEVLARIMQAKERGLAMVFTRTKRSADRIAADLAERGFAAAAVHGDLGQGARERALRAFRAGKIDILVATDVAARGIDISGVTHVVNYECPDDEKTYLHRIGRTGRAGETGTAVTFVDWEDGYRWGMINKALDLPFPEPEETYSNSPWLYEELEIPTTAKGKLPRSQQTRAGLEAEEIEDIGETGRRGPAGRAPASGSKRRDGDVSKRRDGDGSRRREGDGSRRRDGDARAPGSGRARGGSRGAPIGSEAPAGESSSRPARRPRRRTRAGEAVSQSPDGAAVPAAASSGEPAAGDPQQPARRRRRRRSGGGGSGGGGAGGGAPAGESTTNS